MEFEKEKKEYLLKLYKKDQSKKGEVDKEIIALVDKINSLKDYYTTSSCAGRIMLIMIPNKKRKDSSKWLFVSHQKIKLESFSLRNLPKDIVWFRQEPMILHVACKTLESAQALVDKAKFCGFKRTGIMSTKKRIMVEIAGTEKIDAPISKEGRLIVDKKYLKVLVLEANKKMTINKNKIEKFYKLLN